MSDEIARCSSLKNTEWVNSRCKCKQGYLMVEGDCVKVSNSTCSINSYDNGLGTCVCELGFYKVVKTQQCV